jgi:lysozyme family protein
MNVNFDTSFDRLLGNEGGYVNNQRDPGGETNWGISKRSYPNVDIANLTRDDAKVIYKRDFWDACGAMLDGAVQFQVFDAAVNHGISTAIRLLQRAVGVADDGHWGLHSQSCYENMKSWSVLMLFVAERLDYMRKLLRFDTFGVGWTGRVANDLRYGAKDES